MGESSHEDRKEKFVSDILKSVEESDEYKTGRYMKENYAEKPGIYLGKASSIVGQGELEWAKTKTEESSKENFLWNCYSILWKLE